MGNKKQKVHENESGSHAPLHLSNLFFVYGSIIARHLSLLLKKSDILKPLFSFLLPKNRKIRHLKLYFSKSIEKVAYQNKKSFPCN